MTEAGEKNDKSVDPDLIASIAHDLKTPVGSVRGFLELMEHVGPLNDEQKRLSGRIVRALEHMQELIADFEDIARLESGVLPSKEATDFVILCREAIKIVDGIAERKQISVDMRFSQREITVNCDPHQIRRVLVNLLANAIKYNDERGKVVLQIELDHEQVTVSIRDNGPGIEPDEQPFVFDRFYRAHNVRDKRVSGSGLGLAIVKLIIEQHNGRVWLKSELGVGSTFYFTIPLTGEATN